MRQSRRLHPKTIPSAASLPAHPACSMSHRSKDMFRPRQRRPWTLSTHPKLPRLSSLQRVQKSPSEGIAHSIARSEEHTSELQSLMRISYAVFCLKKKTYIKQNAAATHNKNNDRYTNNRTLT